MCRLQPLPQQLVILSHFLNVLLLGVILPIGDLFLYVIVSEPFQTRRRVELFRTLNPSLLLKPLDLIRILVLSLAKGFKFCADNFPDEVLQDQTVHSHRVGSNMMEKVFDRPNVLRVGSVRYMFNFGDRDASLRSLLFMQLLLQPDGSLPCRFMSRNNC